MQVFVQESSFDVDVQYEMLVRSSPGAAVVTFTGYVRDHSASENVVAMELEHYPGMTEQSLQHLGDTAASRFDLLNWRIVHRYGVLEVAEPIVWVGVTANHRSPAFDACQYLMDSLKTDAPFWKREFFDNGEGRWVSDKAEDHQRRAEWHQHTEGQS